MIKEKICKGHGKAKGFEGCNTLTNVDFLRFGLCKSCYTKWLISDDPMAKKKFNSFLIKNKRDFEKEQKKKQRDLKIEIDSKHPMKLADMYFSRYIRLKHSIDGFCTCYTCGAIKEIKEVDNGHYIKREHKATRYSENNCRPQCKICNGDTKHNGKQIDFRDNLVRELGLKEVENLEILGKCTIKADGLFYKRIADEYRKKLNDLQKELNIKYW